MGLNTNGRALRPALSTTLVVAAALAAAGLAPAPARAGDDPEEIVVTARKAEEKLADVPLAITAFSEQTIEAAGISNLQDIANLTPGLQFYNALGEALPTPIIRGVAPTDIRARENNAAIFIDGVYISGREGLNFSQLDVERIEVVKGPQSALYGRNAFSGAINFITKRPTDDFEAKSAVTAGNRGKVAAGASVSGPLIEGVLKGRAGFNYDYWNGSYDDPLHDQDVGGHTYRTFQGSLLFTPADSLSVLGQVYYSNDEIADSATTAVLANCEDVSGTNPRLSNASGVAYGSPIYSNWCGKVPSISGNDIPKTLGAGGENRELWRSSLNVDWDTEAGILSALTGYTHTQQDGNLDFSRLGDSAPFVYCTGTYGNGSPFCSDAPGTPLKRFFSGVIDREGGSDQTELSQELRFSSPVDEAFRWSAGAYFYDVRDEEKAGQAFLTGAIPADLVPITGTDASGLGAFCPCQGNSPATPTFAPGTYLAPFGNSLFVSDPGYVNDQLENLTKTRSWAGFLSAEQDFLERWKVRGEVRYTWEKKNYSQWVAPDLTWSDNGRYQPHEEPPIKADESWDWVSGRVTLDYKTDKGWLLYTSLANASKSGGFSGTAAAFIDPISGVAGPSQQIVESYDPEKNWTVEVGLKGRTADRRLGVDLSAYRIDWTDIVLPQVLTEYADPTDGIVKTTSQLITLSRNTGDATVWGWELGADLRITDDWTAALGVSYTDAKWDDARQATYQFFPSFYTTDPACSLAAIKSLPDLKAQNLQSQTCAGASGDISGNQMLRVAPWTANATLSYRHNISADWDVFARGDVTWKDKWYIGNENEAYIPPSTFVNLHFGVDSGRYTVEAFVDNLLDYDAPIGAYRDIFWTNTQDVYAQNNPPTSSLGDFPPIRLTVNQPSLRTFGLTARVRFGGAER